MEIGDVDNASHDRRVPAEKGRISEDSVRHTEREGQMVPMCRMDEQKAWHGCGCTFYS